MRRLSWGVWGLLLLLVMPNTARAGFLGLGDGATEVKQERYDNGNLKLELRSRDGVIVRKRAFYRNGQVKLDHQYQDGDPVRMRNYYENGHLQSVWTKNNGVTKYYDQQGKLRSVVDLKRNSLNRGLKPSYLFRGGK